MPSECWQSEFQYFIIEQQLKIIDGINRDTKKPPKKSVKKLTKKQIIKILSE